MLHDAGLIIPAYHTDANGVLLGAEINERVVKYLVHDSGILLALLGIDDDTNKNIKVRNPQKHINRGGRCSLENFGTFDGPDGKRIDIMPLYAMSKLFSEK